MTDLFGRRPLRSVVRECRMALGGRAKRNELVEAVRNTLTMAEYQAWADRAFRQAVLAGSKSSVAEAGEEAVYGVGEEVSSLALFTIDEFLEKALYVARLSASNRATVYALAAQCELIHGQTFDAEAVLEEAAA